MNRPSPYREVSEELQRVFREVFEDDELTVRGETSASDVPGWDSLMHVTLILAVERRFGVRFTSSEVAMLRNAGELQDLIDRRQGAQ